MLDYFQRVLEEQLLPSGQVRFFGMSDYDDTANEHQFVSRLTGETTTVRVRRKIVDATYLETPVPSTHTPSFDVDAEARFIPVNGLATLTEPASGYTIIGAGKTAMDVCNWLLDNGVTPDAIRWIRPRDAWILDRRNQQPLDCLVLLIDGLGRAMEAAADAETITELFARIEAAGQLVRIDPPSNPRCTGAPHSAPPSSTPCAKSRTSCARAECCTSAPTRSRCNTDLCRPTPSHVDVDCSAAGLRLSPARPIFETDRITIQQVRTCQPTFNAALIAWVEACRGEDAEKNRLCPPNPYPNAAVDWLKGTVIQQRASAAWLEQSDLSAWLETARLNAARGIGSYLKDPQMQSALGRLMTNSPPAIANLEKLLAPTG